MKKLLNFTLCLLFAGSCTFSVATGRLWIGLVYGAAAVFLWNMVMTDEDD